MKLADFIERPAGEVLVGFALMVAGAIMSSLAVPKGEDAIIAGLTLIGRAMIGRSHPESGKTP